MEDIILEKINLNRMYVNLIEDKIVEELSKYDFEIGIYIGAKDGMINHYIVDVGLEQPDKLKYVPNTGHLNEKLAKWFNADIELIGLVHSHKDNSELSYADKQFASNIIHVNDLEGFFMGVLNLEINQMVYYYVKLD